MPEAFNRLKTFLAELPALVSLNSDELLTLYIAATMQVVSAALIVEWEEPGQALKVQRPIYIMSEVLSDTKV